jgi:hypothetical protein
MSTNNKNSHKDKSREPESTINRDIHRTVQQERFPTTNFAKESRKDSELNKEDDSLTEDLSDDVQGHVGSRTTGESAEDIAGVSDIDSDLRRTEEK